MTATLRSDPGAPPALPVQRRTQMTWVETTVVLTGQCLIQLKYPGLPAGAKYNVSVTGLTDNCEVLVAANNDIFFNGTVTNVGQDGVWTLGVPAAATRAGGDLLLSFSGRDATPPSKEKHIGSNFPKAEGIKLAEVWLRKMP